MDDQEIPTDAVREDPLDLTLAQALGRFARGYLAGRNLAPRTRVEYLADLRDALAFLREKSVERANRVAQGDLEAYLAELDRGASRAPPAGARRPPCASSSAFSTNRATSSSPPPTNWSRRRWRANNRAS